MSDSRDPHVTGVPRMETLGIHAAAARAVVNSPAAPAIYQTAAFEFDTLAQAEAVFDGRVPGGIYGTNGTPNVTALERVIAALEGAHEAVAFDGGCGALMGVFSVVLHPGSRVVASRDLFGGTVALLRHLTRWGVSVSFGDVHDDESVSRLLADEADLVIAEAISNPRMRVAPIQRLATRAHARGALLVIDNTFATPLHCRPLALGADLVVESLTKSLAGHFDVVAGAVAGPSDRVQPIREYAVRVGTIPSPMVAWLATRGLQTFVLRQQRASRNAEALAGWLAAEGRISVHYPGLPSHPDRGHVGQVLSNGFGSMLSFELPPHRAAVDRLLGALSLVRLVHSLGGTSTTLSHSATMTHRALSAAERAALGIHDGFLRLSVGVEHVDDIKADLAAGLAAMRGTSDAIAT